MNVHTIELSSKELSAQKYWEIRSFLMEQNRCNRDGKTYPGKRKGEVISDIFNALGIKIILSAMVDSGGYYHYTMYVKMNLHNIVFPLSKNYVQTLPLTKDNIDKVEAQFDKCFRIMPKGVRHFHSFLVNRVDLCCDITNLEESVLTNYLRVANGCLIPYEGKRFMPCSHRIQIDFKEYSIVIYDKYRQLCTIPGNEEEKAKGTLRFELAVNKYGIQSYAKELYGHYRRSQVPPSALLLEFSNDRTKERFLKRFSKVFYDGNYYPMSLIRKVVSESSLKSKSKADLISITQSIAIHHSIEMGLAEYAAEYENENKARNRAVRLLRVLNKMGINPYPLSARCEPRMLLSIPNLLNNGLSSPF